MKILFITPDFYPSSTGFANASLNLINAIHENYTNDIELFAFATTPLGTKKELGYINVIRYKEPSFNNRFTYIFNQRRKFNYLKKIIDKENIDIIFFETNTFPFLQNWILNRYGSKVFVRIHSTADTEVIVYGSQKSLLGRLQKKSICDFMKNVNNIVSTSDYYLDFIKKHYLQENVYSIWNDKTYNIIYNTAGDVINQAQPANENVFITMGKMSSNGLTQKGILDLLKSVYYLKKKSEIPDGFKVIVIGDGEMRERIDSYIKKLRIEPYIQIIPKASHEEVFGYISKSKAVVLLSRYEGQSMFITESLALGKPLVITKNNGMEHMVEEGVNGFLVETGDYKAAGDILKNVMSMSFEEINEMGIASKKKYDNNYSSKAVCDQFKDIVDMIY